MYLAKEVRDGTLGVVYFVLIKTYRAKRFMRAERKLAVKHLEANFHMELENAAFILAHICILHLTPATCPAHKQMSHLVSHFKPNRLQNSDTVFPLVYICIRRLFMAMLAAGVLSPARFMPHYDFM